MRELAAGNYDPVEADCRFHEFIIAATNNRFYQPLGALVRTALPRFPIVGPAPLQKGERSLPAQEFIAARYEQRLSVCRMSK